MHTFVADLGDDVQVDGDDGHHLARVRRLESGEHVTAADGTGAWREYVVDDVGRGSVALRRGRTGGSGAGPGPEAARRLRPHQG